MFRRPLILLSISSLLLVLSVSGCGNGDAPPEFARPAMVERARPASAAFEAFPGDVRAREEAVLGFRVSGKIIKRLVDAGAQVEKGDLLAELDPEDLRLQVAALQAQLVSAQTNLATQEGERDRYRNLLDRKLVSQSLFDAKQNAYKSAEAELGQVRAQLNVGRNQAAYAQLRAPQNGVIAVRHAEAGQVVTAGQAVFTLATDGEREIAISLPERDIERFALGQPVLVELWSQRGVRVPGKIRELSPAADSVTRTYAARVSFDAESSGAQLGQSARVYAGEPGVAALSVPLSAVTAEGQQAQLWVVDPATTQVRRALVELGPYGESRVPVISGITADDWLVVAGVHLLRDGQKVRPVDRDNRPVNLAATR